jgi:hypothetical protein
MKKLFLSTLFTVAVGVLAVHAQNPTNQRPSDEDPNRVIQDTVIDNSNIPDTAGNVIDEDNMVDTTGVMRDTTSIENKNDMNNKSGNETMDNGRIEKVKPSDKTKTPGKSKKYK